MKTLTDPLLSVKPAQKSIAGKKPDITIRLGYLFLFLSVLIYSITEYTEQGRSDEFTIFIIHYFIALAYIAFLIYHRSYGIRKSWYQENIHKTIILLNLFLVSAYALNRAIPVFEDSTEWLCGVLIMTSVALLSYHYFEALPGWVNRLQHLMLGVAIVLYGYMTLFVAGYYPVASIGVILFGIGAHIFVPFVLLISCIAIIHHTYKKRVSYYWIGAGSFAIILYGIGFMVEWESRVTKIERLANQSVMYPDNELPVWVKVGQSLPNDWITRRILKYDLVYTTKEKSGGAWRLMPEDISWDEKRKHDPFVFISSLRSKIALLPEDRVKILHAISDSRHRSNERLWTGDNLTTSYIISDIDIYPDLRIAYIEKYLNVKNNAVNGGWWGNTQEAIYTFQLPEGSVITSLSLWVNGKEEKGILTSKQKATNAYNSIVGVERRDPSVVHWQEGNTVTVRVFPCTPQEERKFKIGITTPLSETNGDIVYKNISFLGPNASEAKETIRLRFLGSSSGIDIPQYFTQDKNGDHIAERDYDPNFDISFKAVPVKANSFTFDGYTYSMSPYRPAYQTCDIQKIYLDINKSWSADELRSLQSVAAQHQVLAYADDGFITLDNANWDQAEALRERHFSLFPFHMITENESSLVITKGDVLSPHLSDFKESKFAESVHGYFAFGKKIKTYALDNRTSTYINSLRELRALEFAGGSIEQLSTWLADKKFPKTEEFEGRIVLHDAQMVITKSEAGNHAIVNNAPDHLARLFAYNNIMRKAGGGYFKDDVVNEALVDEAATAYVVSPVSSLIVLETKEDYARFEIGDKDNSLHNASKQSSGAVPEPHEWALIILFILFVAYTCMRRLRFGFSS